jgi:uncharacterized DUF497 family protein
MSLEFEWDGPKSRRNVKKHGVSFEEASTVFGDPLSITIPDPQHSIEKERWITVGESSRRRLLIVAFTERRARIRMHQRTGGYTARKERI